MNGAAFIGLLACMILASLALSQWLRRLANPRVLRSLEAAPDNALIVVLGCTPRLASGRLNRYFIGRVASAAAAYHHEPNRNLLCTGRVDKNKNMNEATELAEALVAASVPRARILIDSNSDRTIDSIDHVAENFSERPILFVTQPFHLPRTLFLAKFQGLDAWGLVARGPEPGFRGRLRERVAEARGVLDLALRWR